MQDVANSNNGKPPNSTPAPKSLMPCPSQAPEKKRKKAVVGKQKRKRANQEVNPASNPASSESEEDTAILTQIPDVPKTLVSFVCQCLSVCMSV